MPGGGGGEKTEKATPKKRRDEREQGNVLRSQDMSVALLLISTVFVFKLLIGNMGHGTWMYSMNSARCGYW
jgi:flagellar biosynthetic protein FlhB